MQPDKLGVCAQNFDADGVKRSQPYGICRFADNGFNAFFHFFGRTVGKGNDQTVPRLRLKRRQNISQSCRQHFGLAGAGAGQHQNRTFRRCDGFPLFGVKLFQPRKRRHGQRTDIVIGLGR